jgi:hypothetical protein
MLESGSYDMTLGTDGSNGKFYIGRNTVAPSTYTNSGLETTALLTVTPGGSVGIGTTSPVHSLQVAGTIGAEEVIVSSTGADYVFDDGYKLAPLNDVAAYIAANHHLPDIPSAEEMKENGASVSEMQSKMLAKIEELTLHMIEIEGENHDLRHRMEQLEKGAK